MFERIKKLCDEQGMSIRTLEERLGLSNAVIARLKDPNKRAYVDTIQKVAEYFDVPIDYILYGEKPEYYYNEETAKIAQEIYDSKELKGVFKAARDVSPEDLMAVHTMLLALKRKERGE